MTIELVKILEAAQNYKENSDAWFDYYQESNDDLDWQTSQEYRAKCNGLLEAYAILTGRNLYQFEIKEELTMC